MPNGNKMSSAVSLDAQLSLTIATVNSGTLA